MIVAITQFSSQDNGPINIQPKDDFAMYSVHQGGSKNFVSNNNQGTARS